MKKKNGFTLAEVLITLAIIGIVAALTIPTLMTDSRYQLVSSRVSKFVSVTEDAALAYAAMNGEIKKGDLDEIILYKSTSKSGGKNPKLQTNHYELKDGTALETMPEGLFLAPQAAANFLASDFVNSEKYGVPIEELTFFHNVSGIDNVKESFQFIMTDKGYVFPSLKDTCASAMFDTANDKKNPWKLTKQLADGVCKKTAS